MVVLQARAQLQETIIARRQQHKCAGDWQPPFMVVLKASCDDTEFVTLGDRDRCVTVLTVLSVERDFHRK